MPVTAWRILCAGRAGSIDFIEAVRLVRKRGEFMQQAVPPGVGAMAALLKLPEGRLDALLREASMGEIVSAANFNSPDQVVIAGHAGAVARAIELAKAAGARKAVALPVSAPFHCSLMHPAQEKMRAELGAACFRDLEIPLVNNWQARQIETGQEARLGLIEQIPKPVLWSQSIRCLVERGVTRFIEVGPGSVLIGLLRNIDSRLTGLKFGEAVDLPPLIPEALKIRLPLVPPNPKELERAHSILASRALFGT
ncbi:MAG: ACP S-malonyltransferase [Bryobacteraceae bacterium]